MPQLIQAEVARMRAKIAGLDNDSLLTVWGALRDYDPKEMYDHQGKISMDDWAEEVYSELNRRKLISK